MSTPRPPVPNVAKIVAEATIGGINVAQVFYGRYNDPAPLSGGNAAAIGAEFATQWGIQFLPLLNPVYVSSSFVVTDLHTPTGVQVAVTGAGPGTKAGVALPANACLVLKQSTSLRGRSFRGRTFFSGLSNGDQVSPDLWGNTAVTAFSNAMVAFVNNLASEPHVWAMGIVSYFGPPTVLAGSIAPGNPKRSHSTPRALPIFNLVIESFAEAKINSQRRRTGSR